MESDFSKQDDVIGSVDLPLNDYYHEPRIRTSTEKTVCFNEVRQFLFQNAES